MEEVTRDYCEFSETEITVLTCIYERHYRLLMRRLSLLRDRSVADNQNWRTDHAHLRRATTLTEHLISVRRNYGRPTATEAARCVLRSLVSSVHRVNAHLEALEERLTEDTELSAELLCLHNDVHRQMVVLLDETPESGTGSQTFAAHSTVTLWRSLVLHLLARP